MVVKKKFKLEWDRDSGVPSCIVDVGTGRKLCFSSREDMMQLVELLNDYYLIVRGEWL